MKSSVEIVSNGRKVKGFNSVSVCRALDQIAATYACSLFSTEVPSSRSMMLPIFPDDDVEIYMDGEMIIKGYNERTSPVLRVGSAGCTVAGKEVTADLVKCSCSETTFENKKVDEIVRRICAEFGIVFDGAHGADLGSALKSYAADPSAKAYDVIMGACRERRLFPVSNGLGHISLANGKYDHAKADLVQGVNVLAFNAEFSNENRYSSYSVISSADASGKTSAEVLDDEVRRQRRWVLMDSEFPTKENCESRAMWEAKHRHAQANSMNVTVHGWRQKKDGPLWAPGEIVSLEMPSFIGDAQEFLINRVSYQLGREGYIAILNLVDTELYSPAPTFPIAKKKVSGTKAKKDVWSSIRKQTGSKLR